MINIRLFLKILENYFELQVKEKYLHFMEEENQLLNGGMLLEVVGMMVMR